MSYGLLGEVSDGDVGDDKVVRDEIEQHVGRRLFQLGVATSS